MVMYCLLMVPEQSLLLMVAKSHLRENAFVQKKHIKNEKDFYFVFASDDVFLIMLRTECYNNFFKPTVPK